MEGESKDPLEKRMKTGRMDGFPEEQQWTSLKTGHSLLFPRSIDQFKAAIGVRAPRRGDLFVRIPDSTISVMGHSSPQ